MLKKLLIISIITNILLFAAVTILLLNKFGVLTRSPESSGNIVHSYLDNPRYDLDLSLFRLNTDPADVIFAGDSYTYRGNFEELLTTKSSDSGSDISPLVILNRGIDGDTTEGLLNRLDELIIHDPGQLFIMIGVNDIYLELDIDETYANYTRIIETLHENLPDCRLFIESVIPENNDFVDNEAVMAFNERLEELASSYDYCTYIDLCSYYLDDAGNPIESYYAPDDIHLNADGYAVWVDVVEEYVGE